MTNTTYRSLEIDYCLEDFDSLNGFLDAIFKAAFAHYSCVFSEASTAEYFAIKTQDNAEVFWNYKEFNELSK